MSARLPEVRYAGEGDPGRRYWNPEMETMPVDRMRELQAVKLRRQVAYLAEHSPFYADKFREAGFRPGDLGGIEDLEGLPFTRKTELRDSQAAAPPFGRHVAAAPDRLIRVTTTAGTTGRAVLQAYTRNDVLRRSESVARALWGFGVRPGDRVVNGFALSMFNAGVPFCVAIEHLGALSVPVGAERRAEGLLRIARDVQANVLILTPSFARYLVEKAPEVLGAPVASLGIRIVAGGGEPGFELPNVRGEMERAFGGAKVFDLASTSDAHPNSFANCEHRDGKHHLTPDLVLVQLIDPVTGRPVAIADGVEGEYVFTHLDREACPLLRYRTNDIVRVKASPCACGRTGFRIDVIGRSDDMLLVRGMNLFPSAMQAVVSEFAPRASGRMQIVLSHPGPVVEPPVVVEIETAAGAMADRALSDAIARRIRDDLFVTAEVRLLPFGGIEHTPGKSRLVVLREGMP